MGKTSPIAEVVLHPVRLRIVQQLGGRRLTTAQLRAELPDVTQATLYRHIAALIDAEIVTVVDERRVRGTIERALALDHLQGIVGVRACEIEEHATHALKGSAAPLKGLDGVGEGGSLRALGNGGDLRLLLSQGRVEGGPVMLRRDALEGREAERACPLAKKRIGRKIRVGSRHEMLSAFRNRTIEL